MMTVAVNIVTWNGKQFLPYLLRSLDQQTLRPKRILIIDNGSIDGTTDLLREWPHVHVLRNNRNLGFAHGHNQGFAISDADAVLIVNQDLILDPRCIERLTAELERDDKLGSVCPQLFRFSFSQDDLRQVVQSGTIDAAGMILRRTRQAINRGEGQDRNDTLNRPADVFGAPGVLALYRKKALDDVAIGHEWFDDDFFAYKEDVDLAWRLQWAGWGSRYVPDAVAFHYRTLTHHNDTVRGVFTARTKRSALLRTLSYRNHLLMLVKNETARTFLPHLPFILFYEIRRLGYLILREWGTLRAIPQAFLLLPTMIRKRRIFKAKRRVTSAHLRRLIHP